MPSDCVPGRLNGFTRPFSPAQVAAWAALAGTTLEFLMFISPLLPVAAAVILTLLYLALVGLVLYYGGQAQAIDPVDPFLRRHLQDARPQPQGGRLYQHFNPPPPQAPGPASPGGETQEEEVSPLKQCWLCDTQVKAKSMHCKFCNKCVDEFDHHCIWLNTCIGKRNYSLFYRTMLALFAMLVLHALLSLALVIASYSDTNTGVRLRMEAWGGSRTQPSTNVAAIRGILIFILIFDLGSLFLLGQLIWFHIGLQRKGLSTYEYIVQDFDAKRERTRKEAELETLRVRQVNKARRDGRPLLAARLQVGRHCRRTLGCAACDPLEIPKNVSSDAAKVNTAEQGFAGALGFNAVEDGGDSSEGDDAVESRPHDNGNDRGVTFVKVGADTPDNDVAESNGVHGPVVEESTFTVNGKVNGGVGEKVHADPELGVDDTPPDSGDEYEDDMSNSTGDIPGLPKVKAWEKPSLSSSTNGDNDAPSDED